MLKFLAIVKVFGRNDGRTDGQVKNYMPPYRGHKKEKILIISIFFFCLNVFPSYFVTDVKTRSCLGKG